MVKLDNNSAPKITPKIDSGKICQICRFLPFNSCFEAIIELNPDANNEYVFVTFAITGGSPTINNAGYETSDANPAALLEIPARKPAGIKNKTNLSKLIISLPSH